MRHTSRRTFLQASTLSLAAALAFNPLTAHAADWPERAVRMIVAFPAGGPTDVAARAVAQKLSERLGQPVVVENRPGASGSIGTAAFVKSAADGYTISMFGMPALVSPLVYGNNLYDVRTDFTTVATVYDLPYVIVVNPQVLPEVSDLPSLIAAAKAKSVDYTTPGTGSIAHLAMEQLKGVAGFDMLHIPYSGSAPAITDLLGGQVGVMMADTIAAMPHIRSGRLKAVALGSVDGKTFLPDVKAISEQGYPDFAASSWSGLVVPNGTPTDVTARLEKELSIILTQDSMREQMEKIGAVATYQSGADMKTRLVSEFERWDRVVKDNKITNH
ncbi:tripartite tricarboxylate transporter substrate binding protein [Achromobacter sp. GG226]|uniref:Bug family tripartite tricarboxylate transporter substrate binding protein n=1 Tax=Verticiella alkaliphila TaxID=2779529 RepID=UPI001C0A96C9|nr:tripartite tricarboxylate transporter substrate binding protein [Verticiella sp. GG226]MBU4610048.1 tripartite tricarboxylate transporter substrate binding protein [Verticiella sp. GG226]